MDTDLWHFTGALDLALRDRLPPGLWAATFVAALCDVPSPGLSPGSSRGGEFDSGAFSLLGSGSLLSMVFSGLLPLSSSGVSSSLRELRLSADRKSSSVSPSEVVSLGVPGCSSELSGTS